MKKRFKRVVEWMPLDYQERLEASKSLSLMLFLAYVISLSETALIRTIFLIVFFLLWLLMYFMFKLLGRNVYYEEIK